MFEIKEESYELDESKFNRDSIMDNTAKQNQSNQFVLDTDSRLSDFKSRDVQFRNSTK